MSGRKRRWLLLVVVVVLAVTAAGLALRPGRPAARGGDTAAGAATATAPASGGAKSGTGGSTSSTGDSPSMPATPWPSYLPNPRDRMLLGAFTSLAGQSSGTTAAAGLEAAMGRSYDLQLTYYNWTDTFPDAGEATIAAQGGTPLMTWYGPSTLTGINDGSDDALIRAQAAAIKAFGHRIYLRLMPEMNGDWYPGLSGNPAGYIAAWQRIHRLFAQAGVTNVTWVWCPNVNPGDWDKYYPGNAYVDVIGVDGFSNVKYGAQSFQQMFSPFLTHYAGRKPLLIVETASNAGAGAPAAGVASAASYISAMGSYLENVAGPRYGVIGVCWFDTNDTDQYDWRVNQTAAAWQAWLTLARNPYFGGHGT